MQERGRGELPHAQHRVQLKWHQRQQLMCCLQLTAQMQRRAAPALLHNTFVRSPRLKRSLQQRGRRRRLTRAPAGAGTRQPRRTWVAIREGRGTSSEVGGIVWLHDAGLCWLRSRLARRWRQRCSTRCCCCCCCCQMLATCSWTCVRPIVRRLRGAAQAGGALFWRR